MDRLRPNEKQLEGSFVVIDKQVVADPVTLRIEELIEHNLIQLGIANADGQSYSAILVMVGTGN